MRWLLFLVVALSASSVLGQVNFQPVLLTGQEAPDVDTGSIVTYAWANGMGDNGHVFVWANMLPFDMGPATAVSYMGLPGNLQAWYRLGDPAPGLDASITLASSPSLSRITSGGATTAFVGLQGPGLSAYNSRAVYVVGPEGSMQLALRDGQPAPQYGDSTGVEFGTTNPFVDYFLGTATHTIADDMRFLKPVRVEGNAMLYGGLASDPHIQLRVGHVAPGLPGTTVADFAMAPGEGPVAAGAGKITVRGTIAGAGVSVTNDNVVWSGDMDALQVLLREGDPVPGMHPGNRASGSEQVPPSINGAGESLIWTGLAAGLGDTTASNSGVLLAGTPGELNVVLRKGDQVPGLPPGVVYGQVSKRRIGNGGLMGLVASLSGPGVTAANGNDSAILTGFPGELTVRIREGDQVPGYPPNHVYGDFRTVEEEYLYFSRTGAFVAWVGVRSLITGNSAGRAIIYGAPGNAPPVVVLRSTDSLEVAPGFDMFFHRAIPVGVSDHGTVLINVEFLEDGESTGVYIASFGDTGACCVGAACSVIVSSQCGGNFQGPATSCSPDPCQSAENCCRGTTCNAVDAGSCTGSVAGSASVVVGSCGAGDANATCCYADFNHDGIASIDDLFLYFNAYFTGSPWANMGGDGVESPTIDDLFLFINAYFSGCS